MKWNTMFWMIMTVTCSVIIYSAFDIGKSLGRKEIIAEITKPGSIGEVIDQQSDQYFPDPAFVEKYTSLKLVIDREWYSASKKKFPAVRSRFDRNGRPDGAMEVVFDFGTRQVRKSFADFESFIGFDPSQRINSFGESPETLEATERTEPTR